jgi:HPt (histidine-containing phosphotransfer) domain-containing protein
MTLPEVFNEGDDDLIIENPDSILRRFGGERGFIIDVKHLFASEMSDQLLALTQAFTQHDDNLIGSIAHTIKGTSSNIGAKRLAAFAASLEQNINNGINVDSVDYLSQMQDLINDSLQMLDTLFPDDSAAP